MGGVVSSGHNNDDLINNLLEADYIKTSLIERVFRAVDRAEYLLPEARANAYKDLAWKSGNLHLSAPCIYSEVMEGLCLEPGLSFLNLGSGTGYLSTMAGLIIGCHGINHGIEIYDDVIQYAKKKLEDFKKHSGAIDEYDFCEPKFIQGNCLCLTSESFQYDRVYCGAACPEAFQNYMKTLLKIGGILVMPLNEQLLQVKRTSERNWDIRILLPVSFASLVFPLGDEETVQNIQIEPKSLQALCRSSIRNILRKNIEVEHPPAKRIPPINKAPKRKRTLKRLVVPLFESDDSSDDDHFVRIGGNSNPDAGRAAFHQDSNAILNFVLGTVSESFLGDRSETNRSETNNRTEPMDTESNEAPAEAANRNETQVQAVIEHNPEMDAQEDDSLDINNIHDVFVEVLNVLRSERSDEPSANESSGTEDNNVPESSTSTNNNSNTTSKSKREKFDSGLGDEFIETRSESSDRIDFVSSSDDDDEEDEDEKTEKQNKRTTNGDYPAGSKLRRFDTCDSSSENERDSEDAKLTNEMQMYVSPYTGFMKAKIQELPLPPILKRYLNFYREF